MVVWGAISAPLISAISRSAAVAPLGEEKHREIRRILEARGVASTAMAAQVGHTLEAEPDVAGMAPVAKPAE